jgi:hypothetical protein
VNGQLLYSKVQTGKFPDEDEMVKKVGGLKKSA